MKSKTKIEKQLRKKTNSELVETILNLKKNQSWLKVAEIISGPRRKRVALNLDSINEGASEGETVLVPGKVLSRGEIGKKIRIVAFDISKSAMEKLKNAKIHYMDILEEIKKNPEAKNIRILTEK